ncbi:MAG: hypothetical protein Ct9H300mP22_4330 [Gammaproteobacteria bacterium]|nr:MAG: hypothetical protein Ct9H300mP22_4330 [Gammaproteobacteria bacterium]
MTIDLCFSNARTVLPFRRGFTDFEEGPRLFEPTMRHSAVMKRGNYLYVFWTRVGDGLKALCLAHRYQWRLDGMGRIRGNVVLHQSLIGRVQSPT